MGKRIEDLDPYGSYDLGKLSGDIFEVSKNSGTNEVPVYTTGDSRRIRFDELAEKISFILEPYLPLIGGDMSGNINFLDNIGIFWESGANIDSDSYGISIYDQHNNYIVTDPEGIILHSNDSDAFLSLKENTVLSDGDGDYLELNEGLALLTNNTGSYFQADENGVYINDGINGNNINSTTSGLNLNNNLGNLGLFSSGNLNFNALGLNASTVPYLNASNDLKSSTITPTELSYLSGVTSGIQAQLAAISASIGTWSPVQSSLNISGAVSIDLSTAQVFYLTLTGNVTSFTFTNAVIGKQYMFYFIKGTVNYTFGTTPNFAWTAGKFRFANGTAMDLMNSTTNGTSPAYSVDIMTAFCAVAGRLDIVYTPNMQNN